MKIKHTLAALTCAAILLQSTLGAAALDISSVRAIPTESLAAQFAFEGGVSDDSGSITGTYHGTPQYVTGLSGSQALKFDGKSYIDLGTNQALQPKNITVSFWVKPDESLKSQEHILTWFKGNGKWNDKGWYMSIKPGVSALLFATDGGGEIRVPGDIDTFYPVGEWTHVAVSYSTDTNETAVYRNGVKQQHNVQTATTGITATDCVKYVGFNSPAYNGGFARLTLDELRIYSQAASADDVLELYAEHSDVDYAKILELDCNALSVPARATGNLSLPVTGTNGSKIAWTTSAEAVISTNGTVTRPAIGQPDAQVTLTAHLTLAGLSREKTFAVQVPALVSDTTLKEFALGEVAVTDAYFVNAQEKDIEYLKSLSPDKLLAGFFETAGLAPKDSKYGSWEDMEIRGHTLGHYLSAMAKGYANTKDPEILETLNYIIAELKVCQDKIGNGYLSAFPESFFDRLENGQGVWVPWYTMHKVVAGLLDVAIYTGEDGAPNAEALAITKKLGDWVDWRTGRLSEAKMQQILGVEYGGMNEVLYNLAELTGEDKYAVAAHRFDQKNLFDSLLKNQDVLTNVHANTTIPKFVGALKRYQLLGDSESEYLTMSENFWSMVVNTRTYVTGGNSENEHFGPSDVLADEMTNVNNETCNVYNMLKLSRELFKETGDVQYADFYEKAFMNSIMASINPQTGMTMYFQPMKTGYFKVYGDPTDSFWCCTGTGMENFTKLNDSLYFHDADTLYVNQYVSSNVTWQEKNIKLTQTTDLPVSEVSTFMVNAIAGETTDAKLKFRAPSWATAAPVVTVNGQPADSILSGGYITLSRTWNDGDTVEISFPMELQSSRLPDDPETVAFTYGPLVLSAGLGTNNMAKENHGIAGTVKKPNYDPTVQDYVLIDTDIDTWLADLEQKLVRDPSGALAFNLTDGERTLTFTPHYKQHTERYGIYWKLISPDSEKVEQMILEQKQKDRVTDSAIDDVLISNEQHESAHNIQSSKSETGSWSGERYRHANPGGYFSYDMAVDPKKPMYLLTRYWGGDVNRNFNIFVDGKLLKEERLTGKYPNKFYNEIYTIPAEMTAGKEKITVKYEGIGSSYAGGIYACTILRDFDTRPLLTDLKVSGYKLDQAISESLSDYTVTVGQDETKAELLFTPVTRNALVYVNGRLINDAIAKTIALDGDSTIVSVKVKAEDHTTERDYTLTINKGEVIPELEGVTLPSIENLDSKADTTFTLPVSASAFGKDSEYKAVEGVVNIPEGITVTSAEPTIQVSENMKFNWHLDGNTLRFAFLSTDENPIAFNGGVLINLGMKLTKDAEPGSRFAVDFTRFRVNTSETTKDYDLSNAKSVITVADKTVSPAASELYTGDGSELIPADKKAVSVVFTGLAADANVLFGDVQFYHSEQRSRVTGQVVYVGLVDKGIELTALSDIAAYTVADTGKQSLVFGETDDQSVINAQDALNIVSAWLRKGDAPDSKTMLAMNVSADSKIDTTDAIDVINHYIYATEFTVVTK